MRVIIFLASIFLPFSAWANTVKSAEYVKYVDEIVHEFSAEMARDYNLICIGDGGRMPHDVEMIEVEFHASYRAALEEARELEVKATYRLLDKINQHAKIRPFLREYPFKPFRAKVNITFVNEEGTWWPPEESIAFVFQAKNILYYYKKDPSKKCDAIEVYSEPFEEADKLVAQSLSHDFKGRKFNKMAVIKTLEERAWYVNNWGSGHISVYR